MDIPTDSDGRVDRLDIAFLHQQLLDQFAEALEVCFGEEMAAADGLEPLVWTTGHLSQKGGEDLNTSDGARGLAAGG